MNLVEIPQTHYSSLKLLSAFNDFVNYQTGEIFKSVFQEAKISTDTMKEARLVLNQESQKYFIEYTTNDDNTGATVSVD